MKLCQGKLSIVAAGMNTCDLLLEHVKSETEQVTAMMHACWPAGKTCLIYDCNPQVRAAADNSLCLDQSV